MESFRIGGDAPPFVLVSVTGRAIPGAKDYWDGNWVTATIEIAAGAFRGRLDAEMRTDELARFRAELESLYEKLIGHAIFRSLEEWLTIDIEGDGKGHLRARCEACDRPGMGNRLTFAIDFDQTEMPAILRQLGEVCSAYPVIGK